MRGADIKYCLFSFAMDQKTIYSIYIFISACELYGVMICAHHPRMMGICARNCLVDDFLLVGQALINNRRAIL